jgi:hypothetical protein
MTIDKGNTMDQRDQALADRRSSISAKAKRMVWITFQKY